MSDLDTGYRVFIRTVAAVVSLFSCFWVLYFFLWGVPVIRPPLSADDHRLVLKFWLFVLAAFYFFISFCVGQFLWPLGTQPTLARLRTVFLVVVIILVLLAPLFQKGWL